MRIAYMLTSLSVGGAERQVLALAERMKARGHNVVLIVLRPKHASEIWMTEVEVVRLDMTKSPRGIWIGLINGCKRLRSFKPEIVHSHTFPANIIARVLRLIGAAPRVLSTIHNVFEGGLLRTIAYRLTDWLTTHTTAVSKTVAERYVEIGAVPQRKCSVLTNGIDTEMFSPSEQTAQQAKRFLYEPGEVVSPVGAFKWMVAARLVPAKDVYNLLAAFGMVRAEEPSAQLWIAGYWTNLPKARIAHPTIEPETPCPEGVHWFGVCEDMPAMLEAADGFVLSSAWEGMPLVVGEAMAMERPVVATDVGGVRELVGHAGLVVPSRNPKALAEAMLRVMRMPESDRRDIGKAARSRIVQHFDMNAKADEWEQLYTRILSDGR